ncbi:MAG: hypothetical protein JXL80_12825 [Planctomycetes bacterium]|nr:hypothetical protein [Planctomycetota bacterium]
MATESHGSAEGDWVRVTKRLRFQDQVHPVSAEGRLVERRRIRAAGSFAGSSDGRLWVDEVVIEKVDGERSAMIVDQYTRIETLPEPEASRPVPQDETPAEAGTDRDDER